MPKTCKFTVCTGNETILLPLALFVALLGLVVLLSGCLERAEPRPYGLYYNLNHAVMEGQIALETGASCVQIRAEGGRLYRLQPCG